MNMGSCYSHNAQKNNEAGIIVGSELAAVIAENPTHPLEGQLCSFLSHLSILKFIHPATCQLYTTIIDR